MQLDRKCEFGVVGSSRKNGDGEFKERRTVMCDYSLHGIENRLAVQGETLVVYRFPMGSKGLTSPSYLEGPKLAKGFLASLAKKLMDPTPVCAVCIPDGAKLVLTGISPELQWVHRISATETVTFRQTTADEATHRDAVEFSNGVIVGLQKLAEGQLVEVLSLSSEGPALYVERIHASEWR
jgi:hypothetical protein